MTIVQPLLQSWFECCVFFQLLRLEYVKRKDSVPQTFHSLLSGRLINKFACAGNNACCVNETTRHIFTMLVIAYANAFQNLSRFQILPPRCFKLR